MWFSFHAAPPRRENQAYVEKNLIEGLVYWIKVLLLDIVGRSTWYWAGCASGNEAEGCICVNWIHELEICNACAAQ